MDDGRPLSDVQDRCCSANVYIGAFAVADCLAPARRSSSAGASPTRRWSPDR
jgi:hypothetical protein